MANERPHRSNLKKMLHERKMHQVDLARLANLETYQVSNYVNGKFEDMLLSTGVKICEALRCSFDEAFGDKVKEMKSQIKKERGSNMFEYETNEEEYQEHEEEENEDDDDENQH